MPEPDAGVPGHPYAHERGPKPGAACAGLALTFDGRKLYFAGKSGTYSYPAVSGTSKMPTATVIDYANFDYSPASQRMANGGPIPAGDYWIDPSELQSRQFYHTDTGVGPSEAGKWPVSAWSRNRITIHHDPKTVTFGRGGFFIHGGTNPGSSGCIDLVGRMDDFVADLKREAGGIGGRCYIPLKVTYTTLP